MNKSRARRSFGVVAVCGVLAVASAACGSKRTVAPRPEDRSRVVLDAAIAALEKVTSYHESGTVTTRTASGDVRVGLESDVERPDRFRTTTTIGKTVVRSITVAGNTWVLDPKTKKWKSKIAGHSTSAGDPFAVLRALTDPKIAAEEPVGAEAAYRIEGRAPETLVVQAFPASGATPAGGTAEVSIWISKASSLPLRISARAGAFTVDVAFSKFGAAFKIARPA